MNDPSASDRSEAFFRPKSTDLAPPPWMGGLREKLLARHATECDAFSSVATLVALQDRHTQQQATLKNTRSERDRLQERVTTLENEATDLRLAAQGLTLHSLREKELEAKLTAMQTHLSQALENTNRLLSVEYELRVTKNRISELETAQAASLSLAAQLTKDLADATNTNTLLKRENEALQTENSMQRQQFAKEKEENERLIPAVLNAKRMEAELRNEIVELEQRLAAAMGGRPVPAASGSGGGPREAQFVDPEPSSVSVCIAPSYVAYCTEAAHAAEINTVTVTENGRQLWTGGTEKMIKGWDAHNGQPVGRFATPASTVCLDSRSNYLVAGCVDLTCRVWHLPTMRSLHQLTGHTEVVNAAYLSEDAQRIYTASRDCTIKSWDMTKGTLLRTSLCASSCYDLSSTVDLIVTAHFDNAIRLWDVRTGKTAGEMADLHTKSVTSVRVSSDGHSAVTLSRDNAIKLVDLRMLKELRRITDPNLVIASNMARLTMSPDDGYCAVGTSSGCVLVFNLRDSNQPAKVLTKGHQAPVLSVCWSPDGRGLASAGQDRRIVFWR